MSAFDATLRRESVQAIAGGRAWVMAAAIALLSGLPLLAGDQSRTGVADFAPSFSLAAWCVLISGALLGGLAFGAGMVLTRGCASRLLVLSANGNLRALLPGLLFAVTAQSALSGALSPLRSEISSWWMVDGGPARDLLGRLGMGHEAGLVFGLVWFMAALYFIWRSPQRSFWMWVGGIGSGLMVAAAWGYSQWVARESFDPVQIQGLTFSGPSAEWLMRVLQWPAPPIGFEFGLMPGVFLGSFAGALIGGDWKL